MTNNEHLPSLSNASTSSSSAPVSEEESSDKSPDASCSVLSTAASASSSSSAFSSATKKINQFQCAEYYGVKSLQLLEVKPGKFDDFTLMGLGRGIVKRNIVINALIAAIEVGNKKVIESIAGEIMHYCITASEEDIPYELLAETTEYERNYRDYEWTIKKFSKIIYHISGRRNRLQSK